MKADVIYACFSLGKTMNEILFEYVKQGKFIKVTAIEPKTRTEVCVVVPIGLSEQQMQIQALKKLQYVLKKKEEETC